MYALCRGEISECDFSQPTTVLDKNRDIVPESTAPSSDLRLESIPASAKLHYSIRGSETNKDQRCLDNDAEPSPQEQSPVGAVVGPQVSVFSTNKSVSDSSKDSNSTTHLKTVEAVVLEHKPSQSLSDQVHTSLVPRELSDEVLDVKSVSEQQLPCQPELQANIEAVVEMLLENSKRLPGFTSIIEQATRSKQADLKIKDAKLGAANPVFTKPSGIGFQHVNEASKQLESTCLRTSGNESVEPEEPGSSCVHDKVTVDSGDETANNDVRRMLTSLLGTAESGLSESTKTRKETRNQNTERSEHNLIKKHKCPECDKLFPRASSLKRHILLHMDDRPYQCTDCVANYKSYSQLQRHMRLHTGEKPAKCEHCSKMFRTYNELYVHRRTHTGEKPFECKFCGKCFSTRGYRNTHERIHTGEKRFECDICGMKFTESSARRVHRFTHTGETPYKCEVCGRGFTQAGNLSKHMKTLHSKAKPFKCNECEKEFAVKQELSRHFSRVHSSNKPHECKQCGKKYAIFSDLTQHMNTHKNQCSNCGTKFKEGKELERHIMEDCLIPGYLSPDDSGKEENEEYMSIGTNSTKRRRTKKCIDAAKVKAGPSRSTSKNVMPVDDQLPTRRKTRLSKQYLEHTESRSNELEEVQVEQNESENNSNGSYQERVQKKTVNENIREQEEEMLCDAAETDGESGDSESFPINLKPAQDVVHEKNKITASQKHLSGQGNEAHTDGSLVDCTVDNSMAVETGSLSCKPDEEDDVRGFDSMEI